MEKPMKYSVGIDVSKDKYDACFCEINNLQHVKIKATHRFANNNSSFRELEIWIKKQRHQDLPITIGMEATGVYYEKLALYLHQKQYPVAIILPNKAKKYMQSLGLKSKNDSIDAKGLARMTAEQNLELWQPMGDYFYVLRELTRHHEQLQESKTNVRNQLHAIEHKLYTVKEIVKQQHKFLGLIEKQLEEICTAIEKHINSNDVVKHKVENICKIKGLGLLSVATVIAETNGFVLFKNIRQLVSYSGYDVIENQSGKHFGKTKISKRGNSHIRRILHMPAFCVVTHQQKPFVDLFNRVFDKTAIKMKGYVAVQKKLLIYIYTLWKKNEAFNKNHQQDKISRDDEKVLAFVSASEKQNGMSKKVEKKVAPVKTRATQDKHPSKNRSMLSFV